mgnify:CR=1 FL=1
MERKKLEIWIILLKVLWIRIVLIKFMVRKYFGKFRSLNTVLYHKIWDEKEFVLNLINYLINNSPVLFLFILII